MKICVTGGSGFIGKSLVNALISANHEVTVLDIIESDNKNVNFKKIDLTNHEKTVDVVKGYDIIYHMAGGTLVSTIKNPIVSLNSTLMGTANILSASIKNNIGKIIYASSASVYNGFPEEQLVDETMISHPFNTELFGGFKILGEKLVLEFTKKNELDYTILRIGPVFGADKRCSSIINDFILHILNNQTFEIWGDGKRKLQSTDVEDVARGCVLSINSSKEIFNIISPERYSILQIAEILKEKHGLSYTFDPTKPKGQIYPHISSGKSEKMLNWSHTPFLNSINNMIQILKSS
tara:strand:- start:1775 stop:2656 length:882 start_codon:yes stop_codon:yes gene_type:complete